MAFKRLSQIMRRSSLFFKENHVLMEEEDKPSDKVVMVEEELDGIDMGGIGNLVEILLIDEECGNVNVVVDSEVLKAYRC